MQRSVLCLFQLRWLLAFFDLWLCRSNLCLWGHMASFSLCFLSCLSQIHVSLSLGRTLVIGFRIHQDGPGLPPQVKILNLNTPGKTSFLNKVMFTNSRDLVWMPLEGHYLAYHSQHVKVFCLKPSSSFALSFRSFFSLFKTLEIILESSVHVCPTYIS